MNALDSFAYSRSSDPKEEKEEPAYLSAKYAPSGRTFRVLSADGGGVRGIIPAVIIEEISKRSGLESYEFFNLGVGTSTGGLLCAAFLGHDKQRRPLFKASEVVPFWKESAKEIFHERCLFEGFDGIFKSKYKAEGLEKVIGRVTEAGSTIKDHLFCPTLFTSFDATAYQPFYFRSRDEEKSADPSLYEVEKVLRCTTAAATYLPAQQVLINNVAHAFLDGGLVNNNPTLIALDEARCLAGLKDRIEVLSFGTGIVDQSIAYKRLADAGIVTYAPIILNMLFGAMEAYPGIVLNARSNELLAKEGYFRFQVNDIANEHAELDSVDSLDYLEERAKEWIKLHEEELDELCASLKINDPNDSYAKPTEFY